MCWRALLALPAALAGCAPALPTPNTTVRTDGYLPGPLTAATLIDGPLPAAWWRDFQSPALDGLVAAGLDANPTLGQAEANLAAAQAQAAANNGAYLPQISLNPNDTRESYPTGPNQTPAFTVYSLAGTISYDPGLFGARHYTYLNGAALADYQRAELDAARQALVGNIVAAAIGEAAAREQIATTEQIVGDEQSLLKLLNGEYTMGAIPQLNVLQQQSQVLATEATLPPLQTQADQLRDRLAILTGRLPADFAASGITLGGLGVPAVIPVALPSAYLANRPDLRAARAQVAAQNAALGIAVAHLYPDLTLTATGGYAAETFGALFNTSSALWTLAGNLLAPLYDGGILRARRDQAQAQLQGALLAYRGAVLNAFGEAADALQAVRNDRVALARAEAAAQTANAAYQLGAAQFRFGATDYTTVLNAEEVAARQALNLAQARGNMLLDIARLRSVMAV